MARKALVPKTRAVYVPPGLTVIEQEAILQDYKKKQVYVLPKARHTTQTIYKTLPGKTRSQTAAIAIAAPTKRLYYYKTSCKFPNLDQEKDQEKIILTTIDYAL